MHLTHDKLPQSFSIWNDQSVTRCPPQAMPVSILTSVRLILEQKILIIGSRTSLLEVRHITGLAYCAAESDLDAGNSDSGSGALLTGSGLLHHSYAQLH